MGITLNISLAYDPQTQGQTERIILLNRIPEDMLRQFINRHHDDWDSTWHLCANVPRAAHCSLMNIMCCVPQVTIRLSVKGGCCTTADKAVRSKMLLAGACTVISSECACSIQISSPVTAAELLLESDSLCAMGSCSCLIHYVASK